MHPHQGTVRVTTHLCLKRERPLMITYSLYSENIMHYHFYRNTLDEMNKGDQAEKLELSQLQRQFLHVRPAENERVFWTFTDAFGSFRRFRTVATC